MNARAKLFLLFALVGLAAGVLPDPATAHTGSGTTTSFLAGLEHPFTGLDHLLAMIAVGVWAGLIGGRATWVWPAAFVATMAAGGILGANGCAMPAVELAIAASLVALGLLIAGTRRLSVRAGATVVALFALAHGHAHGAEATSSNLMTYGAGLLVATAALHGIGLVLARLSRLPHGKSVLRAAGAGVAVTGALLAINALAN
jgi:urease accessory protein